MIAGLFYLKSAKTSLVKTLLMVTLSELICSAVLTTLLIHAFYGVPWLVLLPGRSIGVLIKIPVLTMLILAIADRLRPFVRDRRRAAA